MSSLSEFYRLNLETSSGVVSVSEPEIEWLMDLVATNSVRRSLETGLGNGFSAVALLLAGVEEHVAVEISTQNLSVAQANVAKVKKHEQRFRLLVGSSDIRLAGLVDFGEKFDLILVDAGGILVVDDVDWQSVWNAVGWHARATKHMWTRIPAPPQISSRPGFAMAGYRRTRRYDMPSVIRRGVEESPGDPARNPAARRRRRPMPQGITSTRFVVGAVER
jgi:hypothetical protein